MDCKQFLKKKPKDQQVSIVESLGCKPKFMVSKLIQVIDKGNISIDSFKGKMKEHLINDLSANLTNHLSVVNLNTDEYIETVKPYINTSKGWGFSSKIKTHKQIYKEQSTDKMRWANYVTYGLNSKLLDADYLEGITSGTAVTVYNKLLGTGIGRFTYDEFLRDTECTDIDLKLDFNLSDIGMTHEDFDKFTLSLQRCSLSPDSFNRFRAETNKGIEFNKRDTLKYQSKPFIKIYNKKLELLNSGTDKGHYWNDVLSKYMSIDNVPDARIEITIKNKKHLKSLGLDNSLQSILFMSMETKREVMKKAVQKNMNPGIEIRETKEKVLTSDLLIRFLFELTENGEIENHTKKKYNGTNLFKLFCVRNDIYGSSKSKLKKKLQILGIL